MPAFALHFALGAAFMIGALLTIVGAVGLCGAPTAEVSDGEEWDIRPVAAGVGTFGFVIFLAAASAILAQIASPV